MHQRWRGGHGNANGIEKKTRRDDDKHVVVHIHHINARCEANLLVLRLQLPYPSVCMIQVAFIFVVLLVIS